MSALVIPGRLLQVLQHAARIAVLTGAGVSQESGLRTFRDPQAGLWSQYKPEDLASPDAFRRDPKLIWDWYAMRRQKMAQVLPNPAHFALIEMAKHVPEFTLITQNVDDLHHKAGSPDVIELHGNLGRVICSSEGVIVRSWDESPDVPCCPRCGAFLRPDVVWFGEQLPRDALERAVQAARRCDVFISIGTSGLVQPAASLAYAARNHQATLVEINLERTPLSDKADYCLLGKAGEILPAIVDQVWGKSDS